MGRKKLQDDLKRVRATITLDRHTKKMADIYTKKLKAKSLSAFIESAMMYYMAKVPVANENLMKGEV